MFITKITICNLFAYYGEISVNFERVNNKNLYCIFGNNGYGKTSFINCAKLLFLGSGLLEPGEIVPKILQNISKIKNAKDFIKGDRSGKWRGILNTKAVSERKEEFFVAFEGVIEGKDFLLKRCFLNGEEVGEQIYLKYDGDELEKEEAELMMHRFLPPLFVDFFFFDGEGIASLSENLHSELKEKIEDVLQIRPLDLIIKQAEKVGEELRTNEIKNADDREQLQRNHKKLEEINAEIESKRKRLERTIEEIKSLGENITERKIKQDRLIRDSHQRGVNLQKDKERLENGLWDLKENLKLSLKNVICESNTELLNLLEAELNKLKASGTSDIFNVYDDLKPKLKEYMNEELKLKKYLSEDLSKKTRKEILNSVLDALDGFGLNLQNFDDSFIDMKLLNSLFIDLGHFNQNKLKENLENIKEYKIQLKNNALERENLLSDEIDRQKHEELQAEIVSFEERKKNEELQKEETMLRLRELENERQKLDNEIKNLEESIDTERIDKKLEILKELKKGLKNYKENLISKLQKELSVKIVEKYHLLLPNDNIHHIEIDENFKINLKNRANEIQVVENQSSGQKQILAIAIFWALNEVSNIKRPLIIDTPLGRIDSINRKNIIENYYSQDCQMIILPTDSEITLREARFIEPILAQSFEIKNSSERNTARIEKQDFQELIRR